MSNTPKFVTLNLFAGGQILLQVQSIASVVDYERNKAGVLVELGGQVQEYIIKENAAKVGIIIEKLK
jgi:hypothetical protein